MAVGWVSTGYPASTTLAEWWNGRKWKIKPTPNPSTAGPYRRPDDSYLAAVSCSSPSACIAVGASGVDDSLGVPIAERWNGRRWTLEPIPHDGSLEGGVLDGVSCVSVSDCTAVGSYDYGAKTLAERWNGRRWKLQPTPNPHTVGAYKSPAQSDLQAVSCSSARACIAVGSYTPAAYSFAPLAERWNGTQWRITPTPGAADRGQLIDVSCSSANACTAVGTYDTQDANADGAERWNGSKWTIQNTPNPYDGTLHGISCPSSSTCTAVGASAAQNSNRRFTLAERWNG